LLGKVKDKAEQAAKKKTRRLPAAGYAHMGILLRRIDRDVIVTEASVREGKRNRTAVASKWHRQSTNRAKKNIQYYSYAFILSPKK
jgi:hypothetical protein